MLLDWAEKHQRIQPTKPKEVKQARTWLAGEEQSVHEWAGPRICTRKQGVLASE
jgi:hypothetical protein